MSRVPREISGRELIRALRRVGYETVRQEGSHVRLSTTVNGEHHLTVPDHNPIKVGTLTGILSDIAAHLELSRDQLIERLFG